MGYTSDTYSDEELLHYGVRGMKWGIRRDVRVLANHRRNQAVKDARNKYHSGKITNEKKRSAIRKANFEKKKYMSDMNETLKKTNSESKVRKIKNDIAKQTVKEVPNHQIIKGFTMANRILEGYSSVSGVAATIPLMAINPALGVGSAALTVAINRGSHAVNQMLIDRLT